MSLVLRGKKSSIVITLNEHAVLHYVSSSSSSSSTKLKPVKLVTVEQNKLIFT